MDKEIDGLIYAYINKKNWKMYIGYTTDPVERYKQHMKKKTNRNTRFRGAIKKYGPDGFVYVVLEDNIPLLSVLKEREKHYIALYKSNNGKYGYNMTPGGEGANLFDPEVRRRWEVAIKRRNADPSFRQKIIDGMAKRPKGEEWGMKFYKPVICINTGIIYKSIREAAIKVFGDPVVATSIGSVCRGDSKHYKNYYWRFYKEGMVIPTMDEMEEPGVINRVICIETGKVYKNAIEAAQDIDGVASSILNCCAGRVKTSYGVHWEYYNENGNTPAEELIPGGHINYVQCLETGEVYQNCGEAERKTGVDSNDIWRCCVGKKGKKKIKTAGNLHWRFYNEDSPPIDPSMLSAKGATKAIICLDTGKVYKSVTEAANELHYDPSCIVKCCKHKIDTYKGVRWAYYNLDTSTVEER